MSGPNLITPRGLERIQRELLWLQKVERPRIVREVAYAASLGDRSENAEYIYGKKRLREIDRRLEFLVRCLDRIEVVDPAKVRAKNVRFGATVVLADEDGNERTWRLYGEHEVDVDNGVISWRSPLGHALVGREEGDEVRYDAPGGKMVREIVAVRYEPCEPLPEGLFPLDEEPDDGGRSA
jgi:transcription elongation factor GreB